MEKKFTFVLVVCFCSVLILSGCGATDKITDKVANEVAEKAAESMVENLTDGQIGIDTKWPEGDVGNLPKPNGTITYVFEDNVNMSWTVEVGDVNKNDFEEYVSDVKEVGYSTEMEMTNDGIYRFSGKHSDKSQVMITYIEDTKSGMIIYTAGK